MRPQMFALVTVLGLLQIAPALGQVGDPSKKALGELQGVWKLTALEREGEAGDFTERSVYWVVKNDRVIYGGEELAKFTLDRTTTPPCFDLAFRLPKAEREGIYTIKDGALKICVNWEADGAKERPQDFSTKDKPPFRLLTFEKVPNSEADAAEKGMGFVGIAIGKTKENTLIVSQTLPDSPARKAGLMKDDVLLQVGGADVGELVATVKSIQQLRPGSELVVRARRDGNEKDIRIKVGLRPFHLLLQ